MRLIILISLFSTTIGFSQKVIVSETPEMINEKNVMGLSTLLELDEDLVRDAWEKKLKEWGGYKTKSKIYTCEKAFVPLIANTQFKIISKVLTTKKGVKVWFAFEDSLVILNATTNPKEYASSSKLLHDFGLEQYILDINNQLKDAEKVLSSTVKEQEKMISKGESIRSSIIDNRSDKAKYEQKLRDNEKEYKILKSDSTSNIVNQKAANENVEKMKRSVEVVRSKISKVE